MNRTVIIVPSQGHDTNSFLAVAQDLQAKLYPHARIVKTTVAKTTSDGGGITATVTLSKLDGSTFTFDVKLIHHHALNHSYAFSGAGHNLTYIATFFSDDGGSQPWGTTANDK